MRALVTQQCPPCLITLTERLLNYEGTDGLGHGISSMPRPLRVPTALKPQQALLRKVFSVVYTRR